MKNKRLLYVLLPAVLLIWGLIFQRIWSAAEDGSEVGEKAVSPANQPGATVVRSGPPKLLLTYADPFRAAAAKPTRNLGESTNSVASFARPVATAALNFPVAPVPVAVAPVVWPALKYLGFINNPRQNSRIALLTINDQEMMLKAGDNRQGVVVASIFSDSVQVTFQGKKKTIVRIVSLSYQ